MNEHLKTILKFIEQMECGDRLVPVIKNMGFLIIKPVVMGGVVQYSNVPETEKTEEQ